MRRRSVDRSLADVVLPVVCPWGVRDERFQRINIRVSARHKVQLGAREAEWRAEHSKIHPSAMQFQLNSGDAL